MGCCITLTGIARDCGSSIGGIKRAWGACFDEVGTPTVTAEIITALGSTSGWKEFEFRKQTGSVTQTITNDAAIGSSYVESEIVFQFSKQETPKRIEINAIAQGDTAWIIQDNNDRYWYFGYDNPVNLSAGTAETGTNFADLNGYNITLSDLSKQLAYEVSASAMSSLI